ncbi:sigma-70 family RNA polymerase sigma factor [Nocardioides dubius]|uniref:RNA polymerase sigma factor n=1 Tax=Nocardioides dubius TaxID=317019 RepID=A0ABN1TRR0_9ACTN
MADDGAVTRARQGDPEAWRELYAEHAGRLLAWLRLRPLGDAALSADDVAGEAWFVAASKIADFEGTSEEFAGWLFGIARKLTANAQRTAQRRATTPQEPDDLAEAVGPAEDHAGDHERLDWVRSVLATLSQRERDCIGLVDALGMEPKQAAAVLGISPVALRVARHRGLRRLNRDGTTHARLLVDQARG